MQRYLLIPVVVVMMVGLILGGCAKPAPAPAPAPTPGPAPTPVGPKEIPVGLVTSLTGMYAGFGQGTSFGIKAATDDINKQGGVYVEEYDRKLPIKLITVNDESDPLHTGTLTEDLIVRDNVQFFVKGNSPAPMTAPLANICDRYKVPNVSAGGPFEPWMGMRQEVESHWPYSWVTGFAIATPAPAGDFRYGKLGYTILDTWKTELDAFSSQTNKKMGVFAEDSPDGIGWYSLFPQALEEWGYDVIGEENRVGLFPMGTNDFSSVIENWKDNNVEILWGSCPAPDFGVLWRECHRLGFEPKMVFCGKAPLFYTDVTSWGGNLPEGIGLESNWLPVYNDSPGIGGTTPQSLLERWVEETGEQLNQAIGWGYCDAQVLFNAIEKAGSLDADKVNKALGETDLMTISHRVKFIEETGFSYMPLAFTQWQKTDEPQKWECLIVLSPHDFMPTQAELLFPIPYE